jgi:hypothetical protein
LIALLVTPVIEATQDRSTVGKTTFVIDGDRIYAELGFVRPDGSLHRALAFVDMGSPKMEVRESRSSSRAPRGAESSN